MDYFQLTTPQKNIWNLQKYYSDTAVANLCGAIFYGEKREEELLKQAIRTFISSQTGFRLRFAEEKEVVQYISDEDEPDIPVLSFESEEAFEGYAKAFAQEPIGLSDRPMYRFVVFSIGDKSGVLVVLSHLISDAWTFGLMAKEVDIAYKKLIGESEKTVIDADYREYVESEKAYFSSDKFVKDKAYWEDKYQERPEETLIKLPLNSSDSISAGRIVRTLPMELATRISVFCREQSVTPAVLFETALMTYLYRINPETVCCHHWCSGLEPK